MQRNRYFFHISYKGTHYRGWQRQAKVHSIQETIEKYLAKALRLPHITIVGCGRTDAGVHASQFIFHTDLEASPPDNLLFILNKSLPKDIVVWDIIPLEQKMHARFDARRRTYDYFVHTQKDPFLVGLSSLYAHAQQLDTQKIIEAINYIKTQQDFRAFCKSPDKHNTTICHIETIRLYQDKKGAHLRIEIIANRFLKGMIRILAQKILQIGEGYFSLEELKNCFETNTPTTPLRSAPADGLYLSKIEYPDLILDSKSIFPIFDYHWTLIS